MRSPVPFTGPSVCLVDSGGQPKGVRLQNPSGVDVYYSDDQRLLDSLNSAGTPTEGLILSTATPPLPPVNLLWFTGKLYFRGLSAGAQVQVLIWDMCPPST